MTLTARVAALQPAILVLRDIHQPAAPSWWPPAPGWWLLAALVVIVVALAAAWWLHRRRRRRAVALVFDSAVAAAGAPAARVAAMSELLRRAARRRDRVAATLQGAAWLDFLDGSAPTRPFSDGPGALVVEDGFRRDVDARDTDALLVVARARYLQLMDTRR